MKNGTEALATRADAMVTLGAVKLFNSTVGAFFVVEERVTQKTRPVFLYASANVRPHVNLQSICVSDAGDNEKTTCKVSHH